jgi:hypothetical protein
MEEKTIFLWCFSWTQNYFNNKFRIASHHLHIESGRYIRVHLRSQGYVSNAAFLLDLHEIIFSFIKNILLGALKSFKNNSAAYEKNFRLRDKTHAPFNLDGQSRTAFRLLKEPAKTISVTVEVLRVGVMIVGVISVGVMTVRVLSVGVMTLSRFQVLHTKFRIHYLLILILSFTCFV